MVGKKDVIIREVISFWKEQGVKIETLSGVQLNLIIEGSRIPFPNDFEEFYSLVNGMGILYPNESDEEGFLIYPIQYVVSTNDEFATRDDSGIYIFADYLQKSWYYGFKVIDANNYEIGIIPCEGRFVRICDKLNDFLKLYLEDAEVLYKY